ncbi:MAG: hypothetical protein M8353_12560 [ANME-2 cluster archaeon]|nr:hypothetical protein [ANME-2 cluster archaeon]
MNTRYETAARPMDRTRTNAGDRCEMNCCSSSTSETMISEPAAGGWSRAGGWKDKR